MEVMLDMYQTVADWEELNIPSLCELDDGGWHEVIQSDTSVIALPPAYNF
jgi:hypothetical protein